MENQGNLIRRSAAEWSDGEEGVSRDLLAVRSVLLGLPTLTCASGFEYRLQRKLDGAETGVRSPRSVRNWSIGWAGVGLGFATALAIAFFAFDLNVNSPTRPMAGRGRIASASNGAPLVPEVAPQTVSLPSQQQTSTPPLAGDEKQLAATKRDTTKPPAGKAEFNDGNIHVVNGPTK